MSECSGSVPSLATTRDARGSARAFAARGSHEAERLERPGAEQGLVLVFTDADPEVATPRRFARRVPARSPRKHVGERWRRRFRRRSPPPRGEWRRACYAALVFAPALLPEQFVRSVEASRDTLGKPRMKLLDVVHEVDRLTDGAPYAVIGGLARILWARKSHTDDLDVPLSSRDVASAFTRVHNRLADEKWSLPRAPDWAHEADDVLEVYHLLHDGAVVDLIAFRNEAFNGEIIGSAVSIPELGGMCFIRPEPLLVTHLLRPGPTGALAAVELVIARRATGALQSRGSRALGGCTRQARAARARARAGKVVRRDLAVSGRRA